MVILVTDTSPQFNGPSDNETAAIEEEFDEWDNDPTVDKDLYEYFTDAEVKYHFLLIYSGNWPPYSKDPLSLRPVAVKGARNYMSSFSQRELAMLGI